MNHSIVQPLIIALTSCLAALLLDSIFAKITFHESMPVFLAALICLAPLGDLLDILVRSVRSTYLYLGRTAAKSATGLPSSAEALSTTESQFAITIAVHNLGKEVDQFIELFSEFRDELWVIDDASTDNTFSRLKTARINVIHGVVNRKKPRCIQRLLDHLPDYVDIVIVLDPDSYFVGEQSARRNVEQAVQRFRRSNAAAMCPNILVERDTWLTQFQRIEYALCFGLGRRSLGDHCVLSGLGFYRRDALTVALQQHSTSVYAEDLETALIILAEREKIYYDETITLNTDGKSDLAGWFSQRVGWFFGLARVYQDNILKISTISQSSIFNFYHFFISGLILTIFLHPLKVFGILLALLAGLNGIDNTTSLNLITDRYFNDPILFFLPFIQYTGIALISTLVFVNGTKHDLLLYALAYPVYAIAHIVPVTVGYLNWFSVNLNGSRMYADHYDSANSFDPMRIP